MSYAINGLLAMPPPHALLPTGRVDPNAQLQAWLAELELSKNSETVYVSMFSKFFSWMGRRELTLEALTEEDIETFLDEAQAERKKKRKPEDSKAAEKRKEHRYRYVRLIERFYIHLSAKKILKRDNPGSRAAQHGVGQGRNDFSKFLSAPECQAVARYIGSAPDKIDEKNQKTSDPSARCARDWRQFAEWREARDKALAAVMLFGAVKVSEAPLMSVNCTTGSLLRIPDEAQAAGFREAMLLPEGRRSLDIWLAVRAGAGIAGDRLFPADDRGEPMHAASIYRRVRRVATLAFEEAALKIPPARLSPQTLRNTYAGMLIERGYPDSLIMDCMGLKEASSYGRLRTALAPAKPKRQGG